MANDIEVIGYSGKVNVNLIDFRRQYRCASLLSQYNIESIILSSLDNLFLLSHFLRRNPLVGLIVCQFTKQSKEMNSFIYRPILNRIDKMFCANSYLQIDTQHKLNIRKKRMDQIGMFLSSDLSRKREKELIPNEYVIIGLSPIEGLAGTEALKKVLMTLSLISRSSSLPKKIMVKIYLNEKMNQNNGTKAIKDYIWTFGGELPVSIGQMDNFYADINKLHLYIDIEKRDAISDTSLYACLNGRPILMPRHEQSFQFFEEFELCGGHYKYDDARELKSQLEMILMKLNEYQNNVGLIRSKLLKIHSSEKCWESLFKNIEKVKIKRHRFFTKRPSL